VLADEDNESRNKQRQLISELLNNLGERGTEISMEQFKELTIDSTNSIINFNNLDIEMYELTTSSIQNISINEGCIVINNGVEQLKYCDVVTEDEDDRSAKSYRLVGEKDEYVFLLHGGYETLEYAAINTETLEVNWISNYFSLSPQGTYMITGGNELYGWHSFKYKNIATGDEEQLLINSINPFPLPIDEVYWLDEGEFIISFAYVGTESWNSSYFTGDIYYIMVDLTK
jgi:hypothetical protein